MLKSFPTDVVMLESDRLSFGRFARTKTRELSQAKSYRIADAFADAAVTPALSNPAALVEALRRMKLENGGVERVSLLLPDSWFRMNLLELAQLPDRRSEADEIVRWALKRTLPIPPELLRLSYQAVGKSESKRRVFVVSALEQTLKEIEAAFASTGIEVPFLEPVGLNLWNAITTKEAPTTRDRIFVHARETEFTLGVFRGSEPIFIRSRNLSGERTLAQEVRLSASYLRDNLKLSDVEMTYLAGVRIDSSAEEVIRDEFKSPITRLQLKDFATGAAPAELRGMESELIAFTGVFAA